MLALTLAKRVQALRVAQALTARQRSSAMRQRSSAARQRTLSTRKPREKLYSITGRTEGTTSTSQTRGHTLRTDTPPSGGGRDTAPQPVETLLAALIGCEGATADFVARMLRTKIRSIDFELEASRDPQGAAHLPVDAPAPAVSRLTRIWGVAHVSIDEDDDEMIERIGRIVHERCPVANMVVASGCQLDIEWRRASAGV
jgi:putative redox protein